MLTWRLATSLIGELYSQRMPRFNVRLRFTFQSSWKKIPLRH